MKIITKLLASATLAASAAVAVPASAQVQGPIATVDVAGAVLASRARETAYSQVPQTYAQQIEQQAAKNRELQEIYKTFDTNRDNQIDDAELAAAQRSPQFPRAQALEQEIEQLNSQIEGALIYAVEQILQQIRPSVEQAAQQKKAQVVLQPNVVLYAPQNIDITQDVIAALNTRVPSVQITPPQGWQPSRAAAQVAQEVQQRLTTLAMMQQRQQQQQQQQQGGEAPIGR
ncbi:MAG: OmpH family outer membrane protein [Erythrobacter sp.]